EPPSPGTAGGPPALPEELPLDDSVRYAAPIAVRLGDASRHLIRVIAGSPLGEIVSGQRIRSILVTVGLAAVVLLRAGAASAHRAPIDISIWGNFGAATASCQRVISRAAALCAGRAVTARTSCATAQLRGEGCDPASVDARTNAALNRAL